MTTFLRRQSRPLSAAAFYLVLMLIFLALNPVVFLNPRVYAAVFGSLPVTIFLAVPLVFVIASGEIDLSFPSVVGLGAWAFALAIHSGWDYFLAFRLTDGAGNEAATVLSETSIKGWLPGEKQVTESAPLPADLKAGRYDLGLAIVDPESQKPAIRLAIRPPGERPTGS